MNISDFILDMIYKSQKYKNLYDKQKLLIISSYKKIQLKIKYYNIKL